MIPKKLESVERHWQKELAEAFTDPTALLQFLDLQPKKFEKDIAARKLFPMRVPLPFAQKMEKGNPLDPLLQQVFPLKQEFNRHPEFTADPLLEQQNTTPGMLHKYQSRVLLIVRGGCAVNCRYCFRRHFPYKDNSPRRQEWLSVLEHIASDSNINEVIFSGGDPLMANDEFLSWLTEQIAKIGHVQRLRIHTRFPVVIPQRINDAFLGWFTETRLKPIMVLHINHANEIDQRLASAAQALSSRGVLLLNQSVLLKDVNDSGDRQVELQEALFDAGIQPYYLHMLDKVAGAQHFDIADGNAKQIMAEMIKRLPGYLVPKLVREIGGQPGKTPVNLQLHP